MLNRLPQAKPQTPPQNSPQQKTVEKKRNFIFPILLIFVGYAVFGFAAWSAARSPVMASILHRNSGSTEFQQIAPGRSFAQISLPKPTRSPQADAPQTAPQPTLAPTVESAPEPTQLPPTLPTATEAVVAETEAVETEPAVAAVAGAEIVADTPTPEYVAPTAAAVAPVVSPGNGVRWFDVDLSDQMMYAYEGDTLVRSFVVSTGLWQTPTLTGRFKVWIKLKSAPMSGPGYYLPNVPNIMYYDGDYGIHGAYWHNNFGVPMSHGCVNLSLPDAEWAYDFASVGTVVNIHY
ncbi:MAG: L,D-transpeptidase family protein [Anaerolineales bacterium]|nr:L,D-transpeptidase family protein [Anaerolineales bacterium]